MPYFMYITVFFMINEKKQEIDMKLKKNNYLCALKQKLCIFYILVA